MSISDILTIKNVDIRPISYEKENIIPLYSWEPAEDRISGLVFYHKNIKRYGFMAEDEKNTISVCFDEEMPPPTLLRDKKPENELTHSFPYKAIMDAETIFPDLARELLLARGEKIPEVETDPYEDQDDLPDDWNNKDHQVQPDGMELDIDFSASRETFRVVVRKDDIKLCKKFFRQGYSPEYGLDMPDANTAYRYAEFLSDKLDAMNKPKENTSFSLLPKKRSPDL